jgi:hypothetical protein
MSDTDYHQAREQNLFNALGISLILLYYIFFDNQTYNISGSLIIQKVLLEELLELSRF